MNSKTTPRRGKRTATAPCSPSDELRRVKGEISEVMAILEGMSMGGVGPEGPTILELDGHVLEHGKPIENNADYHTAQLCWRRLQNIIQANNSLTVSPDAKREANTSGGIGSP